MKVNFDLKRRIMEKFGTQRRFAEVAGYHESHLSDVIRFREEPSDETKEKWAALLDSTVEELFGEPVVC